MQKKSIVTVLIVASALLLSSVSMFAQAAAKPAQTVPGGTAGAPKAASDQDIQMLREDIRAQRKQITAANMTLTADEATKFWPIYDQYIQETVKINDSRWALIQEYAKTYDTMTDAQATDFMKKSAAIDQQITATRSKYVPMFEKVISGKKTALWFQIDRRLDLLINLQLAALIPVVDTTK
jgi:Spy/CpxP family protein refolding chaperone